MRVERMLGRLLLLAGAVIVVGSLLPWQTVGGLGTRINIDGIDSPNNGVVTLVCGVLLGGLGWRMVDAGARPRRAVLALAIVTAIASVWALLDAGNAEDDFVLDVRLHRAYGQWVLLAGTALAVAVGLLLARRSTGDAPSQGDPLG
jgi:hypothetical protein